jgi:hypothetical protein
MLYHKKETPSLPDNSSIIMPIPLRNHKHVVTRYISQAKPGSRFQNAFAITGYYYFQICHFFFGLGGTKLSWLIALSSPL